MKKYIILTFIIITAIAGVKAQDFKISKSTGKLILKLSAVDLEGYDGNQIVFSSQKKTLRKDPKADGLRAINGAGLTDNTGLGISVVDKDPTVEVNQIAPEVHIKILVPKAFSVSFTSHQSSDKKARFKNLENEIEISSDNNGIDLENITGPISIASINGSVSVRFGNHVKGPVSIASVNGVVDVAIPVNTNANINLSSTKGLILVAPELNITIDKKAGDSNRVRGKLGSGGPEFRLSTVGGKIYLRKTQ